MTKTKLFHLIWPSLIAAIYLVVRYADWIDGGGEMIYGSVCSGIEAATSAWHPLGWKPSFFSEIEAFPRAVLKHHYPDVPLHGDFTTIQKEDYEPIELLVGGTPANHSLLPDLEQALMTHAETSCLSLVRLLNDYSPNGWFGKNVPGVLSSNSGKDFGSFLAMLAELGYGFSYRVLDAQYFGVPQRRRRVFVIGHLGDWRCAAAVLFERDSLQGDPPPSRSKGQEVAGTLTKDAFNGGAGGRPDGAAGNHFIPTGVCSGKQTFGTLMANCGTKQWLGNQEALSGDYHVFSPGPVAFHHQASATQSMNPSEVCPTLDKSKSPAVAFKVRGGCEGGGKGYLGQEEAAFTVSTGQDQHLFTNMQVRRLLPIECERLQGFPDEFTNIPKSSDSVRYKALGNSMAVPVMAWLGKRIDMVEKLMCKDCLENTGSYTFACIGCYARWILRFDKPERLAKIESNGRHDIDELKAEIMRRNK